MMRHATAALTAAAFLIVAACDVAAPPPTEGSLLSAEPSPAVPMPQPTATVTVTAGAQGEAPPEVEATETLGRPDPFEVAERVGPLTLPSDCPLPLDDPASMPNSPRDYRAGVHQGIDFICEETGRSAVAAMDGRVVYVNRSYQDPTVAEREALLDIAAAVGHTPPWTLAMLFGNVVVLDHGVVPDVGHVVSVYAHFEAVDDAVTVGTWVEAGRRLGEIGNVGTHTAAAGGTRPRSIHLHWELHIDGEFLGGGLNTADTRRLYAMLFGMS